MMADVAVENPLNVIPPHKRQTQSNIPSIDIEGIGNDDSDEYSTLKKLQRHLELAYTLILIIRVLNISQIHQPARRIHQG